MVAGPLIVSYKRSKTSCSATQGNLILKSHPLPSPSMCTQLEFINKYIWPLVKQSTATQNGGGVSQGPCSRALIVAGAVWPPPHCAGASCGGQVATYTHRAGAMRLCPHRAEAEWRCPHHGALRVTAVSSSSPWRRAVWSSSRRAEGLHGCKK